MGAPTRIFLSSTAEDLAAHREAVRDTIDHYGVVTVRMETFGARPGDSLDVCRRLASQADAVVVVVAHRYGWVPSREEKGDGQKSIARHEVEAALDAGRPVFAYLVDERFPWTHAREQDRLLEPDADPAEVARAVQQLGAFKQLLSKQVRETFGTPDDLAKKVARDLGNWLLDLQAEPPASGPGSEPQDASERTAVDVDAEIRTYCERATSLHERLELAGAVVITTPRRVEDSERCPTTAPASPISLPGPLARPLPTLEL